MRRFACVTVTSNCVVLLVSCTHLTRRAYQQRDPYVHDTPPAARAAGFIKVDRLGIARSPPSAVTTIVNSYLTNEQCLEVNPDAAGVYIAAANSEDITQTHNFDLYRRRFQAHAQLQAKMLGKLSTPPSATPSRDISASVEISRNHDDAVGSLDTDDEDDDDHSSAASHDVSSVSSAKCCVNMKLNEFE